VSNATSVTIDNGVGPVVSSGTAVVSPAMSTNYTLTAANSYGFFYITTPVLVTGAPASGLPDLVITGMSRTGDTVNYSIKNQGDAQAGPSTSRLSVDGVVKANDNVGALNPGQEITRSFAGYTYACSGISDAMVVEADAGGAVVESSEANNSNSATWLCELSIGPIVAVKFGPDLVIEDVWKVSEITGDKIYYRIKNQGNMDAGATTTSLFKYPCDICFPVASDTVLPLAAGASRQEKFGSYNFSATGGIFCGVKVVADRNGDVNEKDEDNNSKSVNCSGL
jgi:subtilase family serine protease